MVRTFAQVKSPGRDHSKRQERGREQQRQSRGTRLASRQDLSLFGRLWASLRSVYHRKCSLHLPRSVSYGQTRFLWSRRLPSSGTFPMVRPKITIWSRFGKGLVKAQTDHLGFCISYGQGTGESPSTERAGESCCVPRPLEPISGQKRPENPSSTQRYGIC